MPRPYNEQTEPDDETSQFWTIDVEDEAQHVTAARYVDQPQWPWAVNVPVLEFIRDEPLESDLTEALIRALKKVWWVRKVEHEDRETFIIAGRPSGRALVNAVSKVLDEFSARIGAALAGMD